jgi:hypothetical protein
MDTEKENLNQEEQKATSSSEKNEMPIKRHRKTKTFVIISLVVIVLAIATYGGIYIKQNYDFRKSVNTYFDVVDPLITNFQTTAQLAASTPRFSLTSVIIQMNGFKNQLDNIKVPFPELNKVKYFYDEYTSSTIKGYSGFMSAMSIDSDLLRQVAEYSSSLEIDNAIPYLTSYKNAEKKVQDILKNNNTFIPVKSLKKQIEETFYPK